MNDQIELNFEDLVSSIKKEDFKVLLLYLQDGKLLNFQDEIGNTPLIIACETNQTKLVDIILSIGVEVDLSNQAKETALTISAQIGNLKLAELLVAFGANYNHQDEDGRTPLMHAIMSKKMEIMQFLIASGTDLELIDKFGMTALMYSLKYFGLQQMQEILDDSKVALLQKQVTQLEEKISKENQSATSVQSDPEEKENSKVVIKGELAAPSANSQVKIEKQDNDNSSTQKAEQKAKQKEKGGHPEETFSNSEKPQTEERSKTNTLKDPNTSKNNSTKNLSPEILANEEMDESLESFKISGAFEGKEDGVSNIISKNIKNIAVEQKISSPLASKKGLTSLQIEEEGSMTVKSLNGDLSKDSTNLTSMRKTKGSLPELEQKVIKVLDKMPQATKKKREFKNLKKDSFSLEDFSKSISNMTDQLNTNDESFLLKGNHSDGFPEHSNENVKGGPKSSSVEGKNSTLKDQGLRISNLEEPPNQVIKKVPPTSKKKNGDPITSSEFKQKKEEEMSHIINDSSPEIEAGPKTIKRPSSKERLNLNKESTSKKDENAHLIGSVSNPLNMAMDLELEEKKELKSTGEEKGISTTVGTKTENSNLLNKSDDAYMKHESEREAIVDKQKYNLKKDEFNIDSTQRDKTTINGTLPLEEGNGKSTLVKGILNKDKEDKPILKGSIKSEALSLVVDEKNGKNENENKNEDEIDLEKSLNFPKEKVNETNKRGQTHLMVAAGKGDLDKVLLLLENDADTAIKDFNGFSALMFACQSGNPEIVKKLVSNKDELDIKNAKGFTALSLAVIKNQSECISALIEAGANKSINIKGETLLTLAVSKDATQAIKILVTLGSDPLEKNRKGRSAVELAKKLKKKKVIAFFNKYMASLMK